MALGTSTSPDEKELQHRNFETPGDAEVAITQNTPNTTNYVSVATETRPQMQTKLLGSTASRLRTKVRYTFGHPMQQYPTGNDMLVDFDGPNDPYRPLNWPFRKKVITTILYGFTTSWITFASAVYSPAMGQIANEFDVKIETATAGISLVLFGFGMGPLIWGPLSELYGRKLAVLTPYFLAGVFSFGTGAARDIQTIMITRFFTGFFGSAPVTNTGGVLADIWVPQQRGIAVVGYSISIIIGPCIAPIIGGALTSTAGWRWTQYLTGILMLVQLILDLLIIEETYAPVLLVKKARRLRLESGNWTLHAKHEEWDATLKEFAQKYLIRPINMLGTPICFLLSLYSAFIYGILYANLGSFTIVYSEIRGWGPVTSNLPFLAVLLGNVLAAPLNIWNNKYYFKVFKANGNRPVPEARLPPMMIGGILLTVGLFLFGWTSDPTINYGPSLVGIFLTGCSFVTIFQAALNYIVDTFTLYSASAVAANTFLRAIFAGALPLCIGPMYHNIGVGWSSTVFGCFAALLIPVPFVFFFCGKKIRLRGEWSKQSV